jgi:phage terminase small subunit
MTATDSTEQPRPARPQRFRRRKYSAKPLATVPDVDALGPAMLACTPKQRRFVAELAAGPLGYGSEVRAARAAGYGKASSTDVYLRVIAHQVLHSPRVQDALLEVGRKVITGETLQCIENVRAVANDSKHRDYLKANLELLKLAGFVVMTEHKVTVERSPQMIVVATEAVLKRIAELAARAGLDPQRQIELTANVTENS